jgi:transcriptional regulator with XRE-family HTH domain
MYPHADLGQEVVDDGRLKDLRLMLDWSLNAMAEVLHTSPQTYSTWERRRNQIKLWPASANRVGQFYVQAHQLICQLADEGVDLGQLVPFHVAASHMGLPQEVLLERYRNGEIDAEDLGILGLWIRKKDL